MSEYSVLRTTVKIGQTKRRSYRRLEWPQPTGDFSITPALVIRGTIHNLCWFLPQMDRVGPHSARPPSSISVRDAGRIARTEQEHQPLR